MHLYFHFFGITIPAYGFFISLGVIIANAVAMIVIKKTNTDINDFIILEAYCFLGAFLGAKALYLIVSARDIDWSRITEPAYFNMLMQSGFVFYGGLIGGLLMVLIAGKIHAINGIRYIRSFIFLIPMIHGFGRVGCFMAGCCYGRPYEGIGHVVFPKGSLAPAGIGLFPVQLLEAALLLIISIAVLIAFAKNKFYTVELYLILYGISRFLLEYMRADDNRGIYFGLSTSQWISIALIMVALLSFGLGKKRYSLAEMKNK